MFSLFRKTTPIEYSEAQECDFQLEEDNKAILSTQEGAFKELFRVGTGNDSFILSLYNEKEPWYSYMRGIVKPICERLIREYVAHRNACFII